MMRNFMIFLTVCAALSIHGSQLSIFRDAFSPILMYPETASVLWITISTALKYSKPHREAGDRVIERVPRSRENFFTQLY